MRDFGGIERDESTARADAGIIEDDVEPLESPVQLGEDGGHLVDARGIAGERLPARLGDQARQLLRTAGGEGNLAAAAGERAGEGGADATAGADDEGGLAHDFFSS